MTCPVLTLRDIAVRLDGRIVLAIPDFALAKGQTCAVLGPNGAGKTTLLHVAALLRRPAAGKVILLGEEATRHNEARLRRSLSVVFQHPILFDTTVLSNAAAGPRFQGRPNAEARQCGQRWLHQFDAAHLADRSARRLSGGEAARIALARAFATDPAVVFLDEPFSALDAPTRAGLLPLLRDRLRHTGTAALLVTHDLDEAFAFGDRVAVMVGGRIVACDEPYSLLSRPPSRAVAQLLGIETILPATVGAVIGEEIELALGLAGPTVRVRARAGSALSPGTMGTFTLPAVAPRAVREDEATPLAWNRLPGVISLATPAATGTRLVIDTPAPVVANAPWDTAARWTVGDRIAVAFSPDAAHFVPEPN